MATDGSPFDCNECSPRDKDDRNCGNRKGLSEAARVVVWGRGAAKDDPRAVEHSEKGAAKVFPLGDIRMYECPLTYITPETREIMHACHLVDDSKQLFHPGGWGAQPYWLVEAIDILKAEQARLMEKRTNLGSTERKV